MSLFGDVFGPGESVKLTCPCGAEMDYTGDLPLAAAATFLAAHPCGHEKPKKP